MPLGCRSIHAERGDKHTSHTIETARLENTKRKEKRTKFAVLLVCVERLKLTFIFSKLYTSHVTGRHEEEKQQMYMKIFYLFFFKCIDVGAQYFFCSAVNREPAVFRLLVGFASKDGLVLFFLCVVVAEIWNVINF